MVIHNACWWQWLSIQFPSMTASTSNMGHCTLDNYNQQSKGKTNRAAKTSTPVTFRSTPESQENPGYSPVELFLDQELYRTSDWGIIQTEEGHANPEAWLKRHQPETDKKWDEAKLCTLEEVKKQDVEDEKIFNPGNLVLRRNHTLSNTADQYYACLLYTSRCV